MEYTAEETEALEKNKKIKNQPLKEHRARPDQYSDPHQHHQTVHRDLRTRLPTGQCCWLGNPPLTQCTRTYRVVTMLHCSSKTAKRHKTEAGHSQGQTTWLCYNVELPLCRYCTAEWLTWGLDLNGRRSINRSPPASGPCGQTGCLFSALSKTSNNWSPLKWPWRQNKTLFFQASL